MTAGTSHILVPTPPAGAGASKRLARMRVPEAADLVLLGDSNAAAWPEDLLAAALPGLRVFNFGLPGDRIQNTLWRLAASGSTHLRPRHVVIVLGTNNLADGDSAADIAAGLLALVREARRLWHGPEVMLSTIVRRDPSGPARPHAFQDRNPSLRHAEERAQLASRSTHDRGASFETPAARAPQDDEGGSFRPNSQDEDVESVRSGSEEREALNALILGMERPGLRILRSDVELDEVGAPAFEPDGIHIARAGYERLTAALAPLLDAKRPGHGGPGT